MAPRKGVKKTVKTTLPDIDELIQKAKEKIETANTELKAEKANLRKLEREKILSDKKNLEEKERESVAKLLDTLKASGKTVEDVVAMIKKK